MTFTATSPTGTKREFYDTAQFCIFRRAGWTAGERENQWADEQVAKLDATSDAVLAYFAPMQCGTAERDELHRRQYPEVSERITTL